MPPPKEANHKPQEVDVGVERDNKYHGAKRIKSATFILSPVTEKLGKAGTGSSRGGLITVHGSVSVGPEVSSSECLMFSPTKESRVTAGPLGTLGEVRRGLGTLWVGQEGGACWLGCEQ